MITANCKTASDLRDLSSVDLRVCPVGAEKTIAILKDAKLTLPANGDFIARLDAEETVQIYDTRVGIPAFTFRGTQKHNLAEGTYELTLPHGSDVRTIVIHCAPGPDDPHALMPRDALAASFRIELTALKSLAGDLTDDQIERMVSLVQLAKAAECGANPLEPAPFDATLGLGWCWR